MTTLPAPDPWADATLAAALFAIDPPGLHGVIVRAAPGPVRDRWMRLLQSLLGPSRTLRKLPLNITDGRLLGGLDLTATLRSGRPVAERGMLAETDGGVLVVPMAERMSGGLAARLCAVLDSGSVVAERDGLSLQATARIGLVALDEGAADDEAPPACLRERLGLLLRLDDIALGDCVAPAFGPAEITGARARLGEFAVPDQVLEALCATALALGVDSARGTLLALAAARASAALAGRDIASEIDAAIAARLVLAPRATRMPASPEDEPQQEQAENSEPEPPPLGETSENDDDTATPNPEDLAELVLAAAAAAIPSGLLAQLAIASSRTRKGSAGKAGEAKLSTLRGRPIGTRPGDLRSGNRLALLDTLRAAAPWQRLRRENAPPTAARIAVRREDFRVLRFRQRTETTTIFVVDASGSSALNRLAEAKGAVELLLADCYVRRDRVALLAFRGRTAELLLPPTTSLVRAKRGLAGLPGGGGTPIAAGIDAAVALADAVSRKGQTPLVVLLTDGRANIGRSGAPGREAAEADAHVAARMLRAARITALLVDTSPRPQPQAQRLAAEMGARYLPLPYAGAEVLSRAVKAAAQDVPDGRGRAA